jgi:hypothetical protein
MSMRWKVERSAMLCSLVVVAPIRTINGLAADGRRGDSAAKDFEKQR